MLTGDIEQLRRVILNLVDNGIKYSNPGGTVTISLRQRGGVTRISVSDNGIGIPESDYALIFDRFYRSLETRGRDSQGVGLGLSIVDTIVKGHGGSIEVDSVKGAGTTFTVSLPPLPEVG